MPAISDELHLRMLILKFLCFVDVLKGESFSFSSWLFLWFSLSLSRRQAIEIKLFLFRISCESLRRLWLVQKAGEQMEGISRALWRNKFIFEEKHLGLMDERWRGISIFKISFSKSWKMPYSCTFIFLCVLTFYANKFTA